MSPSKKKKRPLQGKTPASSAPKPSESKNGAGKNSLILTGLIALAIFALALAVYAGALKAGFIIDDKDLILRNPAVTHPQSWSEIFARPFWPGKNVISIFYRPLVILTYGLDYRLYQEQAFGYHLTNLLLHALCSVLVFLCFSRLASSRPVGALSGLLFALHPAHTQSVIWIAGRTDLLATMFGLSALYLYLGAQDAKKPEKHFLLVFSVALYFMALLAKESAAVLPALLVLADYARKKDLKYLFQPRRLAIYAVYFALVPLYLLIRGRVLGFALGYEIVKPLHWYGGGQADGSRLVTVFKIFFYYLKTTFYPVYLCFECKMAASPSWTDPFALAAIVITLFVLFAAAVAFFKAPLLSLGALWFYLALLPVSNIFPIQDLAMEHFLYLPSAGFCLVLALGFQKAAEALAKKPGRERPLVFGLLALILCSYAVTTWRRSQVYRSDQALWLDTVNKAPLSYRAQYNLAKLFYDQGDKIGAVRRLRLAAMADPSDPYAPHNLGVTLKAMGRLEEAIGGYREAARLKPEDWSFRMDLASALEQAGDREGAVNEYRAALKIEPQSLAAADGLGRVYALLGRCEDAQRIYASTGSKSSPAFIRSLDERCSGNAPAE